MSKSSGTTRSSSSGSPRGLQVANLSAQREPEIRQLYSDRTAGEGAEYKTKLGISVNDESAEKDRDILDSVLGQLSDGIWENSRGMEKYWRTMSFNQDEQGNVILTVHSQYRVMEPKRYRDSLSGPGYSGYRTIMTPRLKWGGLAQYTEKGQKDWVASKIKQVVEQERKDSNGNLGRWTADNTNISSYLTRGSNNPITVGDAYRLYQKLKK